MVLIWCCRVEMGVVWFGRVGMGEPRCLIGLVSYCWTIFKIRLKKQDRARASILLTYSNTSTYILTPQYCKYKTVSSDT